MDFRVAVPAAAFPRREKVSLKRRLFIDQP